MKIKELKENYEKLAKKYSLPDFDDLNNNFEIGKINRDNGVLLRTIRKIIMEKVVSSLGFVEMLLNPVNAPRMYQPFIRTMDIEDKKGIDKIYLSLSDLSMGSLECEIDYNEKSEAELIKKIFAAWNEIKPEFRNIFAKIRKPNSVSAKKDKSYWG
jgi:hypothetical protein